MMRANTLIVLRRHASYAMARSLHSCQIRHYSVSAVNREHDNTFLENIFFPSANGSVTTGSYALITLNKPPGVLFKPLWQAAALRLCADGGSNYVCESHKKDELLAHPDGIVGDLDSVHAETMEYWTQRNVAIHHVENQDLNDLQKCLFYILHTTDISFPSSSPFLSLTPDFDTVARGSLADVLDTVVIYGAFSDASNNLRVDHLMSIMNLMYTFSSVLYTKGIRLLLVSEGSLVEVLLPGTHIMQLAPSLEQHGACGLIPFIPVKSLSTQGLKWNLNNDQSEFGSLISTSNRVSDPNGIVHIDTSEPIAWVTAFGEKM